MNNYLLKTLTPVHIGSGEQYQRNYEFLYFAGENSVALIDDEKVLKLIGEENLDHWLSTVENDQSLLEYLKSRSKEILKANDIARQTLQVVGKNALSLDRKSTISIRGQLKSGIYSSIAGTSLKGAIRTAVLTHLIDNDPDAKFYKNKFNLTNRKEKFSDEKLMRRHFGEDPNHDILRLLQVGDANFESENVCLHTSSINLYRDDWKFKQEIDQFIECLPSGAETIVRIKFNVLIFDAAQNKRLRSKVSYGRQDETYKLYDGKQPDILQPIQLFKIINEHTSILLKNELEFWDKQKSYPDEVVKYIECLEDFLNQTYHLIDTDTEGASCIIRLGWGTGFRNMTGDWQEDLLTPKDYDALLNEIRPNKPVNITYPKTRRMASDGTPLGFIKLSSQK
jgi:CRISPR-associated protein Csm5